MPNETYTEQWFSIGSAARKLNCHSDDIWHLIDTNRLNPLVKIPDFVKAEFVSHPNKNSETLEFTCYLMPIDCFGPANVDKYAFREHLNSVSGCFYLHAGNRLLHDGMCLDLFGIMIAPADPATGDRLGTNIYKVLVSKKISSDDLIIPAPQILAILAHNTTPAKHPLPPIKKTGSRDALGKILEDICTEFATKNYRTPQYNEVLQALKARAKTGECSTLQEVKGGVVYWKNNKGMEKKTSTKQIQNRLTNINSV